MGITEIVQSKGYKQFMAKLYGIGASVVIIGALFKIQHYPGASIMLVCGLSTEAIIFFFSAFEPPHEQPDWSLVYPELGGLHGEEEALAEDPKISSKKSALEKFDAMIESAEITPELFERLGEGLRKMNETTAKLADISDATVATNNYVANFEKASEKVNEFANLYGESAQKLNQTSDALSETYIQTSQTVAESANKFNETVGKTSENLAEIVTSSTQKLANTVDATSENLASIVSDSTQKLAEKVAETGQKVHELVTNAGNELALSYQKLTAAMNEEMNMATEGNKSYGEQLQIMTKNLTALNAIYELQLQTTNEHLEASKELYSGLDEMMQSLKSSAGDAEIYRQEVSKLGKNLAALNTIYGNMLTAMNVNINQ
ncbi:MAG: hypothetical protein Kow0068_18810 [Marinilabiliales bacterium]